MNLINLEDRNRDEFRISSNVYLWYDPDKSYSCQMSLTSASSDCKTLLRFFALKPVISHVTDRSFVHITSNKY